MIYPVNFEDKIGFTRIREMLKENCLFEPGRERIQELNMLVEYEPIIQQLELVAEYLMIHQSDAELPIHQFHDNRKALAKAAVEGAFMEVEEVSGLAKSLESVRLIVKFFEGAEEEQYPSLRRLCNSVKFYPFVTERIHKLLNKHGQIKDNASPELAQIRRSISSKQSSVSKVLNKILQKAQSEGWVEEDLGATIRNGRPVIPIISSQKRSLNGLIHDESATGKTVYIEPSEVVELTNEIRELEYAERREIIKILTQFTDSIRPYLAELEDMHRFLAEIDSIRSRALFAERIKAIKPDLMKGPGFQWEKAIHPLLYLSFQQSGREVVPLTLGLDDAARMLLISGPNAGGKSVCLQTVGLLQYMLQCGMLVPVSDGSSFGIFSGIFIDIGDEQSIDNDLSTYSSHLLNMKHFLKSAASDTLVLIDEFGTGTEPMLGGAIAESILENLNESGTYGVLTTHYTNLKHYAASAEGVVNGAMLFDNHQMQPLYELQIGKPGSSFAFEIARKIGLPEFVLASASDKVGQDHIDFDKHLRDILRDKKYWERKRQKIRVSEKKLEELMARYEEEVGTTEKKRKEMINEAKRQAEEILAKANREIEKTIRDIKEANAERERTREARRKLDNFKQEVMKEEASEEDRLAIEFRKLKEREAELGERRPDLRKKSRQRLSEKISPETDAKIQVGDMVRIKGQQVTGEVISIKGKKCEVVFGHIRSTVSADQLEKSSDKHEIRQEKKASVQLGDWNVSSRRVNFRPEIDLRGKRAEDAMRKVTELLDEAVLVGAEELRILHGKGDGILRQIIREMLHASDIVEWFGDEHVDRGGAGITVVRLSI